MPHPNCYYDFIRDWPTNEGGVLISDPRLLWRIIPALEREEIRIGSFLSFVSEKIPSAKKSATQPSALSLFSLPHKLA